MTVIVFLIDTSASMMQKQYLGTTLLDFARLTVEQFLKQRQRDPASSGDRYMLMTFEEYPSNIKSGWKESQRVFNEQLKALRAKGMANFEQSVESVMRLLTINRMQTGAGASIENYGFGRFPSYAEHVVIVPVVDGSELPADDPAAQVPKPRLLVGNDFTAEPFRWDQRMFPIVLRLGGHQRSSASGGIGDAISQQQYQTVPLPDQSIAETFAAQMGGRSFSITSHRMLYQCIDTIMQRIQSNGVFIRFRQHGPDPSPPPPVATTTDDALQQQQKDDAELVKDNANNDSPLAMPSDVGPGGGDASWADSLVLVKAKPSMGPSFWPIPESFWPETVRNSLPARPAHPVVLFRCERSEPMFNPEFPLDKYELDSASPLVQYMLSRREPNLCWQVFVEGSFKQPGIGHPFGYLKVSSSSTVNLLVMPYNYPDLLKLLAQAKEGPKMIASVPFQQRFDKYLNTVPPYYYTYLKKQLNRLKIAPPSLEEANTKLYGYINLGVHHAKMKQQGVQELEFACMAVQKCLSDPSNANAAMFGANPSAFVKMSRARALLGKTVPLTADCVPSFRPALGFLPSMQQQPQSQMVTADLAIFVPSAFSSSLSPAASVASVPPSQLFKNPFDIPRSMLCAQLDKMRINFEQQVRTNGNGAVADLHVFQGGPPGQKIKLQHAEDLANLPISKMGVYEDYMKSLIAIGLGPKRELEPQAARPHAFGNPFKLDKKSNMYIADEVGEMNAGASTSAVSSDVPSSSSNGGTSSGGGRRRRALSEVGTMATTGGVRPPRRRPGPIDANRLAMWRRRRRPSSVLSCPDEATATMPETLPSSSKIISPMIRMHIAGNASSVSEEQAPLRMVEEDEEDEDEDDGMVRVKEEEAEEREEEMDHRRAMMPAGQTMMMKEEPPPAAVDEVHVDINRRRKAKDVEEEEEESDDDEPQQSKMVIMSEEEDDEVQDDDSEDSNEPSRRPQRRLMEDNEWANDGFRGGHDQPGPSSSSSSPSSLLLPASSSLSSSSLAQRQLLDKQREIRQIVRLKGPTNSNLAERVASAASNASSSRKRTDLLALGLMEARRFKRVKLCELIAQRLEQRQDAPPSAMNNSALSTTAHQNGYR